MREKKYIFLLPIRIVLFILIFFITSIITKKNVEEISKYWTIIVVICNFITIAILLGVCKKEKINYLQLIGYKKSKIKTIIMIGVIIALIDVLSSTLFEMVFNNTATHSTEVMMQSLPIWMVILDFLLLPITSTIAEEGLYLGVGINKANNVYFAIIFYALQHCFFPMILDFRYILYRFIVFMPSIIFMCIYYKKRKDILPIMFEHFVVNLITIIQILTISI